MDSIEVIYVEDDEQEAFIMTIGMRRHNVKVLHIQRLNTETLAQLQSSPYDGAVAVMFDSVLGGENGLDLARKLRDSGDSRVIFLITAGENPNPVLLKASKIEYIRKPANFAELAAALHRLK